MNISRHHDVIFIIGFQGVGKTTLGMYLGQYGYEWLDLDHKMQEILGLESIRSFFCLVGEAEFRKKEREVFLDILLQKREKTPLFISLGGGSTHIIEEYRYPCLYLFQSQEQFCQNIIEKYKGQPVSKIPGWIQARLESTSFYFIQNQEEEQEMQNLLTSIWNERHAIFSQAASHIFPINTMPLQSIVESITHLRYAQSDHLF